MADDQRPLKHVEGWLESALFSSRWLLAPFYLGLALSLVVLLIKFIAELVHIAVHAFSATESEVILGVLALVDLALTGSLLVIVIFSGYENFVSRIDHGDHKDWPEWMGKIDFSALKLKLLSSIVAISAVQLLKQFMSLKTITPENERVLFWLVVIHVVFVVSSVLLALSDRLAIHGGGHDKTDGHGNGGGDGHGKGRAPASAPAPATAAARGAATPAAARPIQAPRVTVQQVAQPRARTQPPQSRPATTADPKRTARVEVQPAAKKPAAPRTLDDDERPLPGEIPPPQKRKLN